MTPQQKQEAITALQRGEFGIARAIARQVTDDRSSVSTLQKRTDDELNADPFVRWVACLIRGHVLDLRAEPDEEEASRSGWDAAIDRALEIIEWEHYPREMHQQISSLRLKEKGAFTSVLESDLDRVKTLLGLDPELHGIAHEVRTLEARSETAVIRCCDPLSSASCECRAAGYKEAIEACIETLKDLVEQGCLELSDRSWALDDIVGELRSSPTGITGR